MRLFDLLASIATFWCGIPRNGHKPPTQVPQAPPRPPPQQAFSLFGEKLYSDEELARLTKVAIAEQQAWDELHKPRSPMGTFQVFKDKSGQWRWRLRAANRKVIAASEAYTRKYDAVRAVQAIDRALKPGYVVDIPD